MGNDDGGKDTVHGDFLHPLAGDDQLARTSEFDDGNKPFATFTPRSGVYFTGGNHFDAGDFV